ncbi:unnamed protein product [Soboliphyme baturini]|uniref:HUWE1-associated protein modifying stress responses n=1 Tax=Soboliphyme baturini TaxID=241478 RepID=A0A183J105_9BILA|nr:unnamed protein product [Soboliphyme baturini]
MSQENHSPRRYRRGFEYNDAVVNSALAAADRDQQVQPSLAVRTDEVEKMLWQHFESVACSIAELYRSPEWTSFQKAASAATLFYKNSVDAFQRGVDLGMMMGRHLLYKEIFAWLRCSPSSFVQLKELENFLLLRAFCSKPFVVGSGGGNGGSTGVIGGEGDAMTAAVVGGAGGGSLGRVEPTESLHMFHEALNTPQDLNIFFEEACHRNGKRRCPQSIDDDDVVSDGRSTDHQPVSRRRFSSRLSQKLPLFFVVQQHTF